MQEFDEAVLNCFLEKQNRLFPRPVAETLEEAEAFLTDCLAVVLDSPGEVEQYFEEEGLDTGGGRAIDAEEVFAVGDGRYLVVEG